MPRSRFFGGNSAAGPLLPEGLRDPLPNCRRRPGRAAPGTCLLRWLPIVLTPRSPEVGGDVSLAPQNLPQDVLVCSWYRSATTHESSRILTYYPPPAPDQIPGPAHTGRETAGPGCTLHIAGLTLSDTGNYTVLIQSRTGTNPVRSIRNGTFTLTYGPDSARIDLPGPIALTLRSPLNLTCVSDSVPAPSYRWVLNGTDTNETRIILTFNPTTWAQQGTYKCRAHNPITNRTAWGSVAVWQRAADTGIPGLAPMPQCGARGCWAAGSRVGGLWLNRLIQPPPSLLQMPLVQLSLAVVCIFSPWCLHFTLSGWGWRLIPLSMQTSFTHLN
uniref:Ig-like domain-containing protein n=1 Tax=Terrapene triunguis TaxID=2587831 RepID=A0A674J1L8_9SAUR